MKRYTIHPIRDAEMTQISEEPLDHADTLQDAQKRAPEAAAVLQYGCAIYDREKSTVDFGTKILPLAKVTLIPAEATPSRNELQRPTNWGAGRTRY